MHMGMFQEVEAKIPDIDEWFSKQRDDVSLINDYD